MKEKLVNLYVNENSKSFDYKPISGGPTKPNYPFRDNKIKHSQRLKNEYESAWRKVDNEVSLNSNSFENGIYLQIRGKAGYDLLTKSLEDVRQNVRLCNIKYEKDISGDEIIVSTVFVPNNKKDFFIKKINKYESADKEKVIGTIESINLAFVDALWTSKKEFLPKEKSVWCEVWLMYKNGEDKNQIIDNFFVVCKSNNIRYKKQNIVFPERIVVPVFADIKKLATLQVLTSRVAEFRIMLSSINIYDNFDKSEHLEFVDDLKKRIDVLENPHASVCLLDTGVNNAHPLLSPILSDEDMHVVDPNKNPYDDYGKFGHGTRMAGICSYFSLEDKLINSEKITINHFLESIKILDSSNSNEPELYGSIVESAISLAEVQNPNAKRSICMAVTNQSGALISDGRPSSWSAAIDSIVSGANLINSDVLEKKLMFISAGNTSIKEITDIGNVEDAVINHSIENPAQSWNAITVGAYTDKYIIPDELSNEYQPVAEPGSYSPFTSSSVTWTDKWPIKPDIVMEGGNLAFDEQSDFYTDLASLNLITTSKDFINNNILDTINMTSSATAQASWIGANIRHEYPKLWPETIRALIIHSAEWTEAMKRNIFVNKNPKKSDYKRLLRICGYGIPNIERAIFCASNRVNLIIEDEIQPFYKKDSGSIISKEMKLHELPWPSDILLDLGDKKVRMKVTLSYYIEPGPGEIGWKDKYRYPSCGLQFDVNNIMEDEENFLKRINETMREDKTDKGDVINDSSRWLIGVNNRNVGSIHSDIWEGIASDLSQTNKIAVYPITGWWKLRTNLKKYNSKIRYSLIVSIETPKVDVDLYSEIKTQIDNKINIKNTNKISTAIKTT